MSRTTRNIEYLLLAAIVTAGVLLRIASPDHEAVDHFDEGVYASVLWLDPLTGSAWPSREFFGPPGLPLLIELCALLPVSRSLVPFLPAMLAGSVFPIVVWWFNRQWFGMAAGLIGAGIVAGSDLHVLFSRMAMTDVPALLLMLLAIGTGTGAVHQRSLLRSAMAGVLTGLAWWLKYTGWLAFAVVASGSLAWWVISGRRSHPLLSVLRSLLLQAACALCVFSPFLLSLQQQGGYSAIVQHHLNYSQGLAGWLDHLLEQLQLQYYLEGITGAVALSAVLILVAAFRWCSSFRFTWNADSAAHRMCLLRFTLAALFLLLIGMRAGATRVLLCVAAGGIVGLLRWPMRYRGQKHLSVSAGEESDNAALDFCPSRPSTIWLWTLLAWLGGLLLTVPLYTPYPRLFLNLICPVWLLAAGGLSWWLEAGIRTAHRLAAQKRLPVSGTSKQLVSSLSMLACVAVGAAVTGVDEMGQLYMLDRDQLIRCRLMSDRTTIQAAAARIADVCCASLAGTDVNPPRTVTGKLIIPDELERHSGPAVSIPELTPAERAASGAVVYAFAEPPLLFHLHQAGVTGLPVGHLNSRQLQQQGPVFLVLGPNARRSPGFWETWFQEERNFRWLGDFPYVVGPVTTTNLYPSTYLDDHPEASLQRFELFLLPGRTPEED